LQPQFRIRDVEREEFIEEIVNRVDVPGM